MESCNTESSLDLPLESLSLQPFLQSLHKEQWQEVRLGDSPIQIIDGDRGKNYPKHNDFLPNGYCLFLNTKNIPDSKFNFTECQFITKDRDDMLRKGKLQLQDIVMTTRGTIGNIALYDNGVPYNHIRINSSMVILRPNIDKVVSQFLLYAILSSKENITNLVSGSAQPQLPIKDLINLTIPLPPLTTQQKIAEILSSFDDKIDLLHRQNKTLESLALTLFRHYFIDNPKRDEWELGKLGDLLLETLAGDWGKEQQDDENGEMVYCIRGTDIADLQNGLPNKTPIRYVKHKKLMQLQPNNGDIIFEISGGTEMQSTGRCIYINNDIEKLFDAPILFSNFCRLLRVKKAEYGYFLYLYLKFLYNNDEFFALENGTSGIKNLDYKVLLYQHEYTIPNEQQIIRFHKEIEIYYYKINQNKKQIQNLQAMRDMLLKAIFA